MKEAIGKHLIYWFNTLEENRKDRAELRRCKDIDDIICTPAYATIYKELQTHTEYTLRHEQIGYIVGLLSHVTPPQGHPPKLSEVMAAPQHGEQPIISKLRFQRLLKIQTRKELYAPMIRIIRQLNTQVNLWSLMDSVYWWEEQHQRTVRKWAMAYYGIAPKSKA